MGAGQTQQVFVYVSARPDATVGPKGFNVEVESDGETLQVIPLTANVQEAQNAGGLSKGWIIGLIVLVVLVVILFLIVAFNKMKGDDEDEFDDDEELKSGQTYY